jgi:hypothetical protein
MLLFPSGVELPAPTQIEQFCSFLALYLGLLGLASLLLPRICLLSLLKIAFPLLPDDLDQCREDDRD